jgi:hypothetical protein
MGKVLSEAGTSFDPRAVELLYRRYVELERLAKEQLLQTAPKLSTELKVERGSAPAAGFAEPWFVIVSPLRRALVSGAVGLVVFSSGGALDMFATRNYLPRISLMLAGALIALVIATLVFNFLEKYMPVILLCMSACNA